MKANQSFLVVNAALACACVFFVVTARAGQERMRRTVVKSIESEKWILDVSEVQYHLDAATCLSVMTKARKGEQWIIVSGSLTPSIAQNSYDVDLRPYKLRCDGVTRAVTQYLMEDVENKQYAGPRDSYVKDISANRFPLKATIYYEAALGVNRIELVADNRTPVLLLNLRQEMESAPTYAPSLRVHPALPFRILDVRRTTDQQDFFDKINLQTGKVHIKKATPMTDHCFLLVNVEYMPDVETTEVCIDLEKDLLLLEPDGTKTRAHTTYEYDGGKCWAYSSRITYEKGRKENRSLLYAVPANHIEGSRIRFFGADYAVHKPDAAASFGAQDSPKAAVPSPEPTRAFPAYRFSLNGRNEVRIRNPNAFKVTAGLRRGEGGKDIDVPSNGTASVLVPDGQYAIYFLYSDKSDALFRGDDFTLDGNGVEIQIVKVVGGNYGIRRVK